MLLLWVPEVKATLQVLIFVVEEVVIFQLPLPLDHHGLVPPLSLWLCGSLVQYVGGRLTPSRVIESPC